MKKSNFLVLVMGIISGLLFAFGMCMCLLPEWNMFNEGIILGGAGLICILITWIVFRKVSGATPIKLNLKVVLKVLYGLIASLVLGVGMSLTMVFEGMMIQGIIVGIVGIVMLLGLIPMVFGWKE